MYKLNAIFPTPDQADDAKAEILARFGDCATVEFLCLEHRTQDNYIFVPPYQAYSGSVSTGGEMPMIPVPAILNTDVPASGDCALIVRCTDNKKDSILRVLRSHGAMSVEMGEYR